MTESETTQDARWTVELLERKFVALNGAFTCTINQPSPSNIEFLNLVAKEYADVWCQHKQN